MATVSVNMPRSTPTFQGGNASASSAWIAASAAACSSGGLACGAS